MSGRRDPLFDVDESFAREQGAKTIRDLWRELSALKMQAITPAVPMSTFTFGPWYRENVGAAGDADYNMRLAVPDTQTTYNSTAIGRAVTMLDAGRIVGAMIVSSTSRTGGTVTVCVAIDNSVTTGGVLGDVALDATYIDTVAGFAPLTGGIPFNAGSTVEPRIRAAGTFTPTTADMSVWLYAVLDG